MKVSELPYSRVTLEQVQSVMEDVIPRVKNAGSVAEVLSSRGDYLKMALEFYTANALSYMRYSINTVDEFYLGEKDYYDEIGPVVNNYAVEYASALLDSPFRAELEKELDFELWIVGGGELEAELREKLRASGARCVKLLGARENPYPYIACADWLVSSSRSESYGLTIQEALLLGVPVAAASCPAVAETLDRRFGVLSEPDRGSLSAALREILSHPELGVKCRENIRAFYDRDSLWEKRLAAVAALFDG